MSFLNPYFLFGALALAAPIILHLVRREKSEIIPFSSLMFLLKVPKRSIRQQMLKNLLLMALRLLLLALLVLAFARPYIARSATPLIKIGQNQGIVMLLDVSYSMRYGDNFKKLKDEAVKKVDAMRDSDRMSLIAFDDSATVLVPPTSDKSRLRASIDTLEPSNGGTRYYEAFSAADRVLGQLGDDQKRLVMISDFQRVGWNRASHENIIGHEVEAEMVSVGTEKWENTGIDSVSVDPTVFTRTYTGRVIARVHNYRKDAAVTVPVSLSLDDQGEKVVKTNTVTIPANGVATTEFTGFDIQPGFSRGRVRVDAKDPLSADNEFLFTLNRREKLNILIADAGGAASRQSTFLKLALTDKKLPFSVNRIAASELTAEEVNRQNVIIVNDTPRLPEGIMQRMDGLRKVSQGQLIILGSNSDLGWWSSVPSFPVKPLQRKLVERGTPPLSITSYDRNHAIFKPFVEAPMLTLNVAQFFGYVAVEPKPGAAVLAKFEEGTPILVESPAGDRGLIVFNSTMDNQIWNDLPIHIAFQPLVESTVRYLSRYNESRGWYTLGEGIPIVGGASGVATIVVGPDGNRQTLDNAEAGQQRYFSGSAPGFYEIRADRDIRLVAVNPSSNEGNLDAMPPDDLLASVKRLAGDTQQSGDVFGEGQTEYGRRQMGWWYLLVIAFLAGIGEIYLANRSQRGQVAARRT